MEKLKREKEQETDKEGKQKTRLQILIQTRSNQYIKCYMLKNIFKDIFEIESKRNLQNVTDWK